VGCLRGNLEYHPVPPVAAGGCVGIINGSGIAFAISEISAQMITKYPAILPDSKTHTGPRSTGFRRARSKAKVKLSTNYLETSKMLVSVGLDWRILPQTMVRQDELCRLEETQNKR